MYARRRVIAALLMLALLWGTGTVYASLMRPLRRVPLAYVHSAIVLCTGWAEDSAAHLRLIAYVDGRATYRCRTRGY